MKMEVNTQNEVIGFFARYKKWILALVGLHVVPSILAIGFLIVSFGLVYLGNDTNFHSFKYRIKNGYHIGLEDGNRDKMEKELDYLQESPWYQYKAENRHLKEESIRQKDEYISGFSGSERIEELTKIRDGQIKFPAEEKLRKRFSKGLDFYVDFVKKKVKREDFTNEEEYIEALRDEGFKAGYEYGYAVGRWKDKAFAEKWR